MGGGGVGGGSPPRDAPAIEARRATATEILHPLEEAALLYGHLYAGPAAAVRIGVLCVRVRRTHPDVLGH